MRRLWFLLLLPLLLCTSCLNTGELLAAPRPGALTERLQSQIDSLLQTDYRLNAPASGENRQSLQIRDLDGDGLEEALLFVRSAADASQRCILLFAQRGEDYYHIGTLSMIATDIQSVSYADLDGNGSQELLVGWNTESLTMLSVYSLRDGVPEEIAEPIPYHNYTVVALRGTQDSGTSLLVVRTDAAAQRGTAEMYNMKNGAVSLTASASLSQSIVSVSRLRVGLLRDGLTGVYVASRYIPPHLQDSPSSSTWEVTDILCYRDETLVNVSLDMETGVSGMLARPAQVPAADIDHDGVLDLARMTQLPPYPLPPDSDAEPDILYEYEWYNFDSIGQPEFVARTYHSVSSARSWYIKLGESWPERYAARRHVTGTTSSVTLYYWPEEEADLVPLLTITSITRTAGDTSEIKGRVVLDETTNHVIVGEIHLLPQSLESYNISESDLKNMFSLVEIDWR